MKYTLGFVLIWAVVFGFAGVVSADTETGECVTGLHDFFGGLLDSPNDTESSFGDSISDGFFGNEPNLLNTDTNLDLGPNEVDPGSSAGNVAPTLSPGPWVNGGGFSTWGDAVKGAVPAVCA